MTIKEQAVSDALERMRQKVAREVEGDSDNPLRVAKANDIYEGVCDDEYPEIVAAKQAASHPLEQQQAVSEIDLRVSAYKLLEEAAAQSNWIPPEYFSNDWIADCAEFLRTGKGIEQAVSGDVVERMAKAIFFRGLPVDESIWQLLDPLTIKVYRQQAQAALTASGVGRMRERIAEQVSEGDGHWRACTGCQERVDGCVSSKDYPFDPIFQCHPGGGCGECGGIGVVWDNIDYADFARTALQDNGENNGSD